MPYLATAEKTKFLNKFRAYCNSGARSHLAIKQKLYALGLWRRDVEHILSALIESGHVNEAGFALRFVERQEKRAKWGRQRMRSSLVAKGVSAGNIHSALSTVDEVAYRERLQAQAKKKWQSVTGVGVNLFIKMQKTRQFLLQRGYEAALVGEVITQLKNHEL
jgi:regulatory protein